ncbi:MAG: hypothetical protein B7Z15_12170 [Rhizobiales bacterium 32-66-8]|nr:MAG: hypothetical protein B7Z15_12170 [Rhizobiales bacterium 32-66-8]
MPTDAITPNADDFTAAVSDLVSGAYATAFTDLLAAGLSDATAAILQPGHPPRDTFLDVNDRWAFAAAFVASELATPLPDIVDLTLSDFITWHRQAARLAAGDFVSATILEGAPCAA